ncbi:hypothetical protein PILCRDRAFT_16579 [Piloderma croceum F 1598]|uniref:CCHC-type domain-containing protein n=1 Tax=Piloderma croceum (strain F 1598) TaxID=765440 RepID=A0A0C3EH07_PILCF|nr:hypothetical protein PILCRDRAFT_16579 [Piloderma croceum F 1598]
MSTPPPAPPAAQATSTTSKERGRRPDPFSDPRNYELFRRQIGIFLLSNPDVYDTDMRKIFFALTLLNEGPPGQWAQNYIERVEAQVTQAGNIPDAAWGTFDVFMNGLRDSFADPNKGRSASNSLETLTYDNSRRADEFFQEFETLAGRAGHINNHAYLIDLLERKLPKHLIKKVYNDAVPTTYPAYKERVIRFDNLDQRLRVIVHHSGPKRSYSSPNYSSSSTSSHAKTSTGVYGGAGEPMDIGRNRPKAKLWVPRTPSSTKKRPNNNKPTGGAMRIKCFGCGKEGHMVSNCPLERGKKRQQIRFSQSLKEPAAPSDSSLVPPPRNRLSVTPPHATSSTQIFDTCDNCTYIATNEINCLNRTKTALDRDDHERLRGPPPLEEEPKEPGTREARRHTLMTKATVLARRVGLERTSINTDQGKGTPFAYTEDVDSSPLEDETSKNSEDQSPSHGEVTRLSDEERQLKDTDWIKKLEELYSLRSAALGSNSKPVLRH